MVAKTSNPLGGRILSLIRARASDDDIGVDEVETLFRDMKEEGAVRAAYVTSGDFTERAYEFTAGKPVSLVNRCKLFEGIRTQGIKPEDELFSILEKYGLTDRYFRGERYSFIVGVELESTRKFFEERAKKILMQHGLLLVLQLAHDMVSRIRNLDQFCGRK